MSEPDLCDPDRNVCEECGSYLTGAEAIPGICDDCSWVNDEEEARILREMFGEKNDD